MRRFSLILFLIVLSCVSFSQVDGIKMSANAGLLQLNSVGLFQNYVSDEGGYVTDQRPAIFPELYFLFSKKISLGRAGSRVLRISRWDYLGGFGFNQKGMVQEGMSSDGTANYYPFTRTLKRNYLSLYLGLSFDLLVRKNIKITLGELFNPDWDLTYAADKDKTFARLALASRTFVAVNYYFSQKVGIRLSASYQQALSNYNKAVTLIPSANYRPCGPALSVGLVFREHIQVGIK